MKPLIAVVDDEARMARVLAMVLKRAGHEVEAFTDAEAFLDELRHRGFDLVLTDLKMPKADGLALLQAVKNEDPDVPVVIITAHGTVQAAVEAIRHGAYDFVEKPFDNDSVRALVRRALDVTRLARENRFLRAELMCRHATDTVIVESDAMGAVFDLVRRAARSPATVLITGDSGTGKERIARAIHSFSERIGGPFVAVNCKAFAASLLESELFGHEKGAFTGANQPREGVFERARGGTVFLDELGEVDLDFQAKLLRVLQEREVQRVGANRARPIDVRVVAATNVDLAARIAEGSFREDLFFRLAVIPIAIPPLRERRADILPLARHFLVRSNETMGRAIQGWSAEVESFLVGHSWPGNVRELENAIERAVVLTRDEVITLDDLMVSGEQSFDANQEGETLQRFLDRKTAERIVAELSATSGKRAEAAKRLGIDRTTLYRLMRRLKIES